MDLKDIKELMNAMRRTRTKRVVIKNDQIELELERESNDVQKMEEPESREGPDELALQRVAQAFSKAGQMPTAHQGPAIEPVVEQEKEELLNVVTSPMVGTFYISPSPEDPPFVRIGDKIDKNTIVCIIEAMKVMNEVKAGVSGIVVEVLVENGHPVEFGTKLYRIK